MVGATWLLCRRLLEGPRFKTRLGHLATGKFCQPISKWVPVLNQGKKRMGFALCMLWARYNGPLTLTALLATRLLKTFTFISRLLMMVCMTWFYSPVKYSVILS